MAKKKVMIIDDDRELLDELQEMLTLNGYTTASFTDGISALDQLEDVKPDVILLDLKLTGKSGFQVADEIKRIHTSRSIPIIAMTGFYTEKQHLLLMNICGIKTCLTKPLNPSDVIARIEIAV